MLPILQAIFLFLNHLFKWGRNSAEKPKFKVRIVFVFFNRNETIVIKLFEAVMSTLECKVRVFFWCGGLSPHTPSPHRGSPHCTSFLMFTA